MVKEISIKIKNSEQNFREKFLIYEDFTCSENDPVLKECVDKAISHLKGEVDSVQINIKMVIQ